MGLVAQDTWGNFRFPEEIQQSKNRFAFTGHFFDTETDLYYAKARYYEPELGRFITADSYLGEFDDPPSLHRYTYAQNRPTFYTDPSGNIVESPWDLFSLGVGIASLGYNVWKGDWGAAGVDVVGIAADTTALLLPGVPGGAGVTIKAGRAGAAINRGVRAITVTERAYQTTRTTVRALQVVDRSVNVGQGIGATVELAAEGRTGWATGVGILTALGFGATRKAASELADATQGLSRVTRPGGILADLTAPRRLQVDFARPTATMSMFGGGQFPRVRLPRTVGLGSAGTGTSSAIRERVAASVAERRAAGRVSGFSEHVRRVDATTVFQDLVRRANSRLTRTPALAVEVLSEDELLAAASSAGVARMHWGNVVERLAAADVLSSPGLRGLFRHVGGAKSPDFVGLGRFAGLNFDATTVRQVPAHMRRAGYGRGLIVGTYTRPPWFP